VWFCAHTMIILLLLIPVINSTELTTIDDLQCKPNSASTMQLVIRIINHNTTTDPIVINHVLLAENNEAVEFVMIGQVFDERLNDVQSSWPVALRWQPKAFNRFVHRAALEATALKLFDYLDVSVTVHDKFVVPLRDYGSVRSLSAEHTTISRARFCLSFLSAPVLNERKSQQYRLAVCSVVRNEGVYLQEWIEWHRLMGVEHFFLYDDSSDDAESSRLMTHYEKEGVVTRVPWVVENYWRQMTALNACLQRFAQMTKWMTAIDVDEFLFVNTVDATNVGTLLDNQFALYGVIRIAWHMFSDRGDAVERKVTRRYEWRAADALLGDVSVLPLDQLTPDEKPVMVVAGKSIFKPNVRDCRHYECRQHKYRLSMVWRLVTLQDCASAKLKRMRLHQPLSLDTTSRVLSTVSQWAMCIARTHSSSSSSHSRPLTGTNRWSDTQDWKLRHIDALRATYSKVHDTNARAMSSRLS
jgi:hypothetical protein